MAKNYVSNKDETVRMFESDFMEFFSRVHFTVPLYVYVPVILILMYLSIFVYNISALNNFVLLIGGVVAWSLAEYVLHRYIFHFKATSEFGKKIHFMFHGVHHDYPSDSKKTRNASFSKCSTCSIILFPFQINFWSISDDAFLFRIYFGLSFL